jgi:hypothetical protein
MENWKLKRRNSEWRKERERWKVEGVKWKVEGVKWKVENGKCKVESGKWKRKNLKVKMENGKITNGKGKMDNGKWKMASQHLCSSNICSSSFYWIYNNIWTNMFFFFSGFPQWTSLLKITYRIDANFGVSPNWGITSLEN